MVEQQFSAPLVLWQKEHGRHGLPWQGTRDTYRIWLSEIMLQQTQVTTVIPYYLRFLERFPDLLSLAQAPLEVVLELWAGLGYYARARNLHRCAQAVVADFSGEFPKTPQLMSSLPGIGRSTAAAICVFSSGTRSAILDGNVKRVLARHFGIEGYPGAAQTEREMWALADSLLPESSIESYTQGLMDLGSLICTRRNPFCGICPLYDSCVARQQGRQHLLPQARPKKVVPERETSLLILTDGQRVLLERRPPVGIWGGLLSLPEGGVAEARGLARRYACRLLGMQASAGLKHTFTHFHLHIQTLLCTLEVTHPLVAESGWEWVEFGAVETVALPAPIRRLLRVALR
ncbi:MAG: A/G-specific adenine glycosylase [Betaproteobacteria bacterium]